MATALGLMHLRHGLLILILRKVFAFRELRKLPNLESLQLNPEPGVLICELILVDSIGLVWPSLNLNVLCEGLGPFHVGLEAVQCSTLTSFIIMIIIKAG